MFYAYLMLGDSKGTVVQLAMGMTRLEAWTRAKREAWLGGYPESSIYVLERPMIVH